MSERKGLVQVYTGEGKGKTTASLGLALRALGHNLSVYMIQFMKGGDTGEMFAIQRYLPNFTLVQFGKDALKEKQLKMVSFDSKEKKENKLTEKERYIFLSDKAESEPSRMGLEHAKKIINAGQHDIVILDEINCVLARKMIPIDETIELIKNRPPHVEIVLTGRDAPAEIIDMADQVSESKKIKHPYDKGILARKGIEY
ncbi:MAG: cob(I)yrinic acid a,c-diamide adenosyltransferase [Nanoarchaeota archaeon]|nr:cob(I)yrinic acid a,c-diamide adenosyltransferase [Nanoarchaeota archaeon]